nr:CMF_HP1_G0046280.mRNA.1.CDS.1 [Saccharomyces cerevisiae]
MNKCHPEVLLQGSEEVQVESLNGCGWETCFSIHVSVVKELDHPEDIFDFLFNAGGLCFGLHHLGPSASTFFIWRPNYMN